MQINNPFIIPEETRRKVPSYWQQKPRRRNAILHEVERANTKIEREREKVVGYLAQDNIVPWLKHLVILCKPCHARLVPRHFRDRYETITKVEYYNKELNV